MPVCTSTAAESNRREDEDGDEHKVGAEGTDQVDDGEETQGHGVETCVGTTDARSVDSTSQCMDELYR